MLLGGATLVASALVAAPPAQAAGSAYQDPQVHWARNVHVHGATATVLAKYRCWGGNEGTHLWVSLKQGAKISAMTVEELVSTNGTSALADAWYDTHAAINCNGKWQVQRYTVSREFGTLKSGGKAFLQFCLFDSTAESGPDADLSQGFAYDYRFVKVHP
jgi:hypothetical protein